MDIAAPDTKATKLPRTNRELIQKKIVHLLSIFPKVSPSMMQIGLGSSIPTQMWKPILRDLINEGIVQEDIIVHPTVVGRNQTYTILSLPSDGDH